MSGSASDRWTLGGTNRIGPSISCTNSNSIYRRPTGLAGLGRGWRYALSWTIVMCCQRCRRKVSMVIAMWSVSNRTGTSNSKSAVISTPAAAAAVKVIGASSDVDSGPRVQL